MKRKSLIYKTGVEYGDYTLNHALGCSHGCRYPCYAYMMAKRFGNVKSYEEWIQPQIVENTLELLRQELPRFKDKIQQLHLCFTTDPFMYEHDEIARMSIKVLQEANAQGIRCSVLTKGLLPECLVTLSRENEYGITVVSLNDHFIHEYEPGAAPIQARIQALRFLHDSGCKTWVSIEPYPTPNIVEQNLADILDAVSFVDKIIFGRLHYNRMVTEYDGYQSYYNQCVTRVIDFCTHHEIAYHIKTGTLQAKEAN